MVARDDGDEVVDEEANVFREIEEAEGSGVWRGHCSCSGGEVDMIVGIWAEADCEGDGGRASYA